MSTTRNEILVYLKDRRASLQHDLDELDQLEKLITNGAVPPASIDMSNARRDPDTCTITERLNQAEAKRLIMLILAEGLELSLSDIHQQLLRDATGSTYMMLDCKRGYDAIKGALNHLCTKGILKHTGPKGSYLYSLNTSNRKSANQKPTFAVQ